MPLSTIFQLYRGGLIISEGEPSVTPEYLEFVVSSGCVLPLDRYDNQQYKKNERMCPEDTDSLTVKEFRYLKVL
jgi:hypothetical protein